MKKFLDGGKERREISILTHTHGFRITLGENGKDYSFGVSDSIEDAFKKALANFDLFVKSRREIEVESLEREIQSHNTAIKFLKTRLAKFLKT